jgi:sodium-coupled neutral amino acid transporter 9
MSLNPSLHRLFLHSSAFVPNARSTMASRMNYYNRLAPRSTEASVLTIPPHVIDPKLYTFFTKAGQSSMATVFSIWNTMIGSTVLSIPWGLEQSGLLVGSCKI